MRCKFLGVVIFILLFPLVSASFEVSNYSLENNYGPEESIKGWINISFSNEPGDKEIVGSSDFDGKIELIEFLKLNSADYSCFPEDCNEDYSVSNGENSKSFSLSYKQEKILGLKLSGNIKKVNSLSFNVSVSNSYSCSNPLEIDILNDNYIEWKSKVIGNNFACDSGKTGCFNSNESLNDVFVGEVPFCEKIKLSPSNKFKIGAWIKKGTTTWYNGLLVMALYDLDNTALISCELPEPGAGEVDCGIEYKNPELRNYYICIRAKSPTDYIMKTESVDSCGFYSEPGEETEYHDYYIYGKAARYENIGSFTMNEQEYLNQTGADDFAGYINSYLDLKYDKNCTEGCIIPMSFKAYTNLDIYLDNLVLGYSTGAGPSAIPEKKIYDTGIISAKISSDFQILDLGYAGITTPKDYGKHNLMLYLEDDKLLNKEAEIEVKKIPIIKNIFPNIVPAAVPTKFTVNVTSSSGKNITEYKWDFGDGVNETTSYNFATHTYEKIRDYPLSLKVKDSAGFTAAKIFTISAESPKKIINSTIARYKERLKNLSSQISGMPEWYKKEIKKSIDVENLNDELEVIDRNYKLSSTSDEYIEVVNDLLDLEIPYFIKASGQGALPFFIDADSVNPSYFEQLGAGTYDEGNKKEFQESITGWSQDVLAMTLDFKYISAYYDDRTENIISVFNLKIESGEKIEEFYVVIEKTNTTFSRDYGIREFSDGAANGIILKDFLKDNIEFAVSYINAEEIVIYASPGFSQLEIETIEPCDFDGKCEPDENENAKNCRSDCKPYGVALVLFAIVILSAIIAYILLQFWYKTRYEKHLFKNKNDLYNILNFIKNAKNQGKDNSEINRALKKAGWTGEQVNYAFKKIKGAGIMPFDFLKLFNKFQKKNMPSFKRKEQKTSYLEEYHTRK